MFEISLNGLNFNQSKMLLENVKEKYIVSFCYVVELVIFSIYMVFWSAIINFVGWQLWRSPVIE
jgi:hypothetical protein